MKRISVICMLLLLIIVPFIGCENKTNQDDAKPNKSIPIDGCYIMTEESSNLFWEDFSQRWEGFNPTLIPERKPVIYIYNNILVKRDGSSRIFECTSVGDRYIAKDITSTTGMYTFQYTFENDILTAYDDETEYQFICDTDIKTKIETPHIKLPTPADIESGSYGISWDYLDEGDVTSMTVLYAEVEIKRADEKEFEKIEPIQIIPELGNEFLLNYSDLQLKTGENIIRINHKGGPYIKDSTMYISEDSDSLEIKLIKNDSGDISVSI